MKVIRRCVLLLSLFVMFLFGSISGLAMDTGFSTEELTQDEIERIVDNVKISMLEKEPEKKSIDCFDVNEYGKIAIGCSNSENKTVCIYSTDGTFRYGYGFSCTGDFGIEFHGDILNIYLVRGDIALSVTSLGEITEVRRIQNSIENNSYWNEHIFCKQQKVGDTEYVIRNDMGILNVFAASYSQLVTVNSSGEETVIYDVNGIQLAKTVMVLVCIDVFVVIVVFCIVREVNKAKRKS